MNIMMIFAALIGFNLVAVVVNSVGTRRQRTLRVDVVDVDAMFAAATPAPDWRAADTDWRSASATPRLVLEAIATA